MSDKFRQISVDFTPKNQSQIIQLEQKQKSPFVGNSVSTSKYNAVSFLLKFLIEQFSKYANIFFLFTACIQQIPGISPTSRFTTVIPLALVLAASAVKEILEDYKRHKSDDEVNNRKCQRLTNGSFSDCLWKELKVGDFVRISNNEYFPADLILLSSSEPDALCYIETSNLDGETNLKIKQGKSQTSQILSAQQASQFKATIKFELPNSSLYTFDGTMSIQGQSDIPLDPQQLLLRGAQLRNTSWIYGLVVFTGHESKLMRNATAAPIKRSHVERMTNKQILILFIILLLMSIGSAIGQLVLVQQESNYSYLFPFGLDQSGLAGKFFLNILTFIILYNNLIPISLIVTMEVVKMITARLIGQDLDIYYSKNDTPTVVKTSSLVEELGQVKFIFSDKTGTLTCNEMEFRECSIAGEKYKTEGNEKLFIDALKNPKSQQDQFYLDLFLICLSVCHTVIPEKVQDKIVYQASSPDEGALVKAAQQFKYEFHTRKPTAVIVNRNGQDEEFEVLNFCEFNSTRKRMSAIVRFPSGELKLLIKGADTVIFERLNKSNGSIEQNNPFYQQTLTHLEEFALLGLRTLCFAYRDLTESEYEEWKKVYNDAATSLENRSQKLDDAAELIEKDLTLIGSSAIEDKLQNGVPECIHTLAEAGIKIWVLTGDRQETAINIGYSCKLLTQEMSLIIISGEDQQTVSKNIKSKLAYIKRLMKDNNIQPPDSCYQPPDKAKSQPLFTRLKNQIQGLKAGSADKEQLTVNTNQDNQDYVIVDTEPADQTFQLDVMDLQSLALIIDGKSLKHALSPEIQKQFLELSTLCKAVICCRVSPLQKALVVRLVKDNLPVVTLAIGDGANDVSMIQAAHVGVGISGHEGLQAARAADIAIAQFRFLRKLLLVHGAWSYVRLSKLILFSFYKNITLYMTQFWFAFYNGFTGQTIYESWTVSLYNVIFTVLPPLAIGIFDQYIHARMLEKFPQLQKLYQNDSFFNVTVFWGWTLNAIYHSILLYFLVFVSMGGFDIILVNGGFGGQTAGQWYTGTLLYSCVLMTVLLKAALTVSTWNKWVLISIIGSFVSWLIFLPIYASVAPPNGVSVELLGVVQPLFNSGIFWFSLIVIPFLCIFRDIVWKYLRRDKFYEPYHIVQEIQKYDQQDYRPQAEKFKKVVRRVQKIQMVKTRGFAFSQNEQGMAEIVGKYNSDVVKPTGL